MTSHTTVTATPTAGGDVGLGRAARSVLADIERLPSTGEHQTHTRVFIGEDEPVFDGHYPGFPLLPGVCLIECAHRSALATCPAGDGLKLDRIESARFLDPVYPGETVSFDLKWTPQDTGWKCRVVASNPRGDSARIRLRYRTEAAE